MTNTKQAEEKKAKKENASSKKRNRTAQSCSICRRRKIKCDKTRPVCTSCERTGVGHLCHYIDPPWAKPLTQVEISGDSRENEVEKLKKKIKQLEKQLHSNSASGNLSEAEDDTENEYPNQSGASSDEAENESLNLGKKFDMLHIKSTTTVHLGATSWLAIMKGDPYLRVLWAHIFKMRKQVEQYKYKKTMANNQDGKGSGKPTMADFMQSNPLKRSRPGKCPVAHVKIKQEGDEQSEDQRPLAKKSKKTSFASKNTCPVSGKSEAMGKCPVAHDIDENEEEDMNDDNDDNVNAYDRNEDDQDATNGDAPHSHSENKDRNDDRVCPLMIGDESFMDKLKGSDDESPNGKKKKTSRSNSNESNKSRAVAPEDFKKNPVEMMQKYLPKKKVLWLFIERFFEVLYIYLPYVEENSFREEVEFIMGKRDDEDQDVTIRIRSGVDFALVGTVCIILRLVWNTLPMNNSNKLFNKPVNTKSYPENTEAIRVMQKSENEVPLELIDCVKHCFSNLKLMRKSSLKIVQCALFMKYYFMYSPEDGDGADGGDSQIFLGMIIQMAISIGLHRDPKNFENFSNEGQRHLWRKIWFALVSLDVSQSVNLGCPRVLQNHEEFSDTKLPGGDNEEDLNAFQSDMRELTVIKNIHTQAKLDHLISKTMRILLNVKNPARRHQVDQLINQLQNSISGFLAIKDQYALPQLGKILLNRSKTETLYSSGTRALQFKSHVVVNMLIYLLNYILYVHYEPRGTQDPQIAAIAKNYAQKALNCALEGYRNCSLFFDCGLDYFGPGADLILSPLLLLVGHRSMQFMVSLILRSRCGPHMRPNIVHTPSLTSDFASPANSAIDPQRTHSGTSEDGSNIIDNRNHDLNDIEIKDETATSMFCVDVDSGEILSTILLEHMEKFHRLAEKLGDKYPYSWRMGKAVGFFITLLKKPTNVVRGIVKTENVKNVENDTGEVSSLLNSVPLVLSTEEEQYKKCPVFYKAEESATRSTMSREKRNEKNNNAEEPSNDHVPVSDMSTPDVAVQQPQMQGFPGNIPFPSSAFNFGDFRDNNSNDHDPNNSNPFASLNNFMPNENMGMPDQIPLMGQGEDLLNFNYADKSLGDMFGVTIGTDTGSSYAMNDLSTMNLEENNANGAPDFRAMMNGSWFS